MKTSFFSCCRASDDFVPCTLVSIVCTGCSTMSFTPTAAARWKTTSLRSIISARSDSLVTESTTYEKCLMALRCAMLSIEPVDRSSRTATSWPRSRSRSARCDPMKPAPPVMSALTRV